jgi:hypothetical protein
LLKIHHSIFIPFLYWPVFMFICSKGLKTMACQEKPLVTIILVCCRSNDKIICCFKTPLQYLMKMQLMPEILQITSRRHLFSALSTKLKATLNDA